MIGCPHKGYQRKAMTSQWIDSCQGMKPIANNIIRLISFLPALSTITIHVGIDSYLFALDLNCAKGIVDLSWC